MTLLEHEKEYIKLFRKVSLHIAEDNCYRYGCVIHSPTEHHMRSWPLNWRDDRKFMERICPCGVGHPDPDQMSFIRRTKGKDTMEGVHGCCGCCVEGGFDEIRS